MRKTPIAAGLATTFIVAASQLADPSSAEAATPETPADACAQAISEDSAEAPNSQSLDRSDLNRARHSLRQAIITDEVQLRTATNPGVVSRADVTRVDGNLFAEVKLSTDDTLVVQLNDDYEVVHYRETQIEEHTATSGRVSVYHDGQPVIDRVFTDTDLAELETPADASEEGLELQYYEGQGFWSYLNECLSNAGVAAWVVAGLAFACGATGPAVVLCITGAGIGAGTASYCVRRALINT